MNRRFFEEALSDWMKGGGPDSDIVISSRVRIARNLRTHPFPTLATNQQSREVRDQVRAAAESEGFEQFGKFHFLELDRLTELQKRVLVEKHLISPDLANESRNGAVLLSENESVSIMINEEDHLRIQVLRPGFQLRETWDAANRIDDWFESRLEYAYDERKGYLTSCPTNVGTGIRVSVMMHLPALAMTQQINRMLSAITKVGLAVRGLYGEGSESTGNLFQISNQITLGLTEEDIIDNLHRVARQIMEHERTARASLMQDSRYKTIDRIYRSYGILAHAAIMDSKEAMKRLSDVRLGVHLGIIKSVSPQTLNELMVMTQPGFLQQLAGEALSPEERDVRRAQLIRAKLGAKQP